MSRPLFSCVVPVKGERPFFDEAIASLRAQGMGDDLEIIVQDADVEPDKGQSDAFNKGFAKARGEWFFWLNADDVLLPGALKKVQRVISDQRLVKLNSTGLSATWSESMPTACGLGVLSGIVGMTGCIDMPCRMCMDRAASFGEICGKRLAVATFR